VGNNSGLYRFDGISFEAVDLRPQGSLESRRVNSLTTTRRGDLWVGFAYGGATVLLGGALGRASSPPGLPNDDFITEFVEDGDGDVWALARSMACYVLQQGKWSRAGANWGLPAGEVRQAKLDPEGALWFAMQNGIYRLKKGTHQFALAKTNALAGARIGIAYSGQLWKLDRNGYALLEGPDVAAPSVLKGPLESATSAPVLLTRDGSWWSVDCPAGICRARPDEPSHPVDTETMGADTFTRVDGLSSDRAMTLYEDEEGNIWVGTKQGLDQFRRNNLINVRFPTPLVYFTIVADAQSGIWSGTDVAYESATDYLWRLDPLPARVPGFSGSIRAAFREREGSIIFGGKSGAWRMTGGRLQPIPLPTDTDKFGIRALAEDRDGHLWASFRTAGTLRLDDDHWVLNGNIANVPGAPATTMSIADSGKLWLGYSDNQVCLIDGATAQCYSSAQGLRTGAVTAILPGPDIVLVGGELALNVFDGHRFMALNSDHPEALKGITGMVRARDGALWLNGGAGAVQIAAADLKQAITNPAFTMTARVFNVEDGMPGTAQGGIRNSSLVEDRQGRLWFAATDGLAWLDPKRLRHHSPIPPVEILSLATPTQTVAAGPGVELVPRTRNLTIRYTALSLSMPRRIRFRVRLNGIDKDWREMGTERSVSYSNLGPGAFQFQVAASNDAGEWNDSRATFDFRILPAFYQMAWFKALCGAMALAILLALIRVQGARLAARAGVKMAERLKERERIARELHDTLIQDVEALLLNLNALNRQFGKLDPAHHELARLHAAAQRSLELARDRVGGLRGVARTSAYLKDVLQELAEQLTILYPTTYRVELTGKPKDLQPAAAEEIVAIGREAILNAFRHARGSLIVISIFYTARALELKIVDDGKGLDTQGGAVREREGHWGLRGMRERALVLKSELSIAAVSSGGTRVTLRVAGAVAYAEDQSQATNWRSMFPWRKTPRSTDHS
jgi:signal transduction histidine kinase/ligand-binding sensor domain-containing protein